MTIQHTHINKLYTLENFVDDSFVVFLGNFQKNPKKDDLADALVQGLTYLHSKYKFENVSLKSDWYNN